MWVAASASLVLTLGTVVATSAGADAATRSTPACRTTSLTAKATGYGAGMSQPAVYITVTNVSGKACEVAGYPRLTGAWSKHGRQSIAVSNGEVMNAPQAKPKTIVIAPGGHAWFAIGAATAYDPPLRTLTRVSFSASPGGAHSTARISLQATSPKGEPIPLGVTAWMAGTGTSQ
jgi:hypothetical protein